MLPHDSLNDIPFERIATSIDRHQVSDLIPSSIVRDFSQDNRQSFPSEFHYL